MSLDVPNKGWMKKTRPSAEYLDGVALFLEFAKKHSGGVDWYLCPCKNCGNVGDGKTLSELEEHLTCNGIDQSYTTWYCHGERIPNVSITNGVHIGVGSHGTEEERPRMYDLVEKSFGFVHHVDFSARIDEAAAGAHTEGHSEQEINAQTAARQETKANKLRDDARQPLYPSCKLGNTKLSAVVELVGLKSTHNWSDISFTELLQAINKLLPDGSTLPDNTRDCLQMIKSLGMDYQTIHACPNDCILYWRDNASLSRCPTCGVSRWKSEFLIKNTRVPQKVLRYFPLTPRLRRLYSVPWIAELMQWHADAKTPSGFMRHPSDSSCWKGIDAFSPEFALEPRHVRLGLSTDGFNPFGNKSLSYSCWPVMVVPYNLPPSFCMLKEFTMLSLLIPGKHSPGKNIDVYLQPLIEELEQLWSKGSTVYDAHKKGDFTMKAVLLWTIQDFPAYGYISGCRTSGKYACPICGEDINSFWLKYGGKFSYMGHRCFLSDDHPFRFQKSQFNGNEEHGKTPRRLNGDEVLEKVRNLRVIFGKVLGKKRKKCDEDEGSAPWSKRSVLFDLPYWKDLQVRHNLDVMHVEKNVTENILATIMGTKDKTKDGLKAHMDLKEMGTRSNLWPEEDGNKIWLPTAPFLLSKVEKEHVCQTLKMLKVPIGYSSNWKYNVNMEDLQIRCPKSHDYHIIIQQLLPVLLMDAYKKHKPLGAAIRQLSMFFNVLCSKVICRKELKEASRRVVDAICVFEKYFLPSFFVSMTHLVVHLAEEARICGPVRFRWMYPFERMMRTYKMYVKNKRHPEACIAERYLVEESILYCMEYMPDSINGGHKRGRKRFMDEVGECASEQPIDKKGKLYNLSNLEYEQARKWVVDSSDEANEWKKGYEAYVKNHPSKRKGRKGNTVPEKMMKFIPWLRQQLEGTEESTLKRLAEGPSFKATSYKSYRANGYVFCTSDSERTKSTQNSGVTMKAITRFRSSAKDKNLVEDEVTYYGLIRKIIELDYYEFTQTVFYCDWVRIEDKVNGCVVDPETKLRFVNLRKLKSNTKDDDEPFLLASQASQVFYCKDPKREDWYVVLDSPKRLTKDVDAYEDPLVFDTQLKADAFSSTLVDEVLDEVITDGIWVEK